MKIIKKISKKNAFISLLTMSLMVMFSSTALGQPKTLKIGVVTFLTGAAADPVGIPVRNAAQILIEEINAGRVPEPYASKGFAGAEIKHIFIDENSKDRVRDYRELIDKERVDMIIGYISSASCKSISPLAEEKKMLTIFAICGSASIFEEVNTRPDYVFRTTSHVTMDNVAAAKYVLDLDQGVTSIAGVNQDYNFGHGSWGDFSKTMSILNKKVVKKTAHFPKIFAGRYAKELSSLTNETPSVVHSSFWGGDLEALVVQGGVDRVFSRSRLILTIGDAAMHRLGPQIPDGTIIGARGTTGQLAEDSTLNRWFKQVYFQRFGAFPISSAYHMAQAILGVKAAADKAESVSSEAIKTQLKGSTFVTPSGQVSMELAGGNQAIIDAAYGTYRYDKSKGRGQLVNIKRYPAKCINPPLGIKSADWIESEFSGSTCL